MTNLKSVYGHKQAKKVLNAMYSRTQERYYKKCVLGLSEYPDRLNCLLIGPSGTGKTHLIRTFAEEKDLLLITVDATELAPSGTSKGINSEDLKKRIIATANEAVKFGQYNSVEGALEQTFVFVDEFDKLGNSFESSGNWNTHVQSSFLTLVEDKGTLAGVSWVFAGAFSALRNQKQVVKHSIGFFAEAPQEVANSHLSERDIIRSGIIPEMLGRIPLIVQLDDFKLDDYVNIVTELLENKYSVLTNVNVNEIASIAMSSGQGVRSISRQLELALIDQEEANPWVMPGVMS